LQRAAALCNPALLIKPYELKYMEKLKLIAIDIDGTLLTPDGQITPRTRAAILAAQQAGVIVTLATSRRYVGAKEIAVALGLELPLIVYDGALIVHHPSQTILHSQPLSLAIAEQIVEIFRRYAVQPVIQPREVLRCVAEEVWTGPAEHDHLEVTTYLSFAPERLRRMPHEQLCQEGQEPLRVVAFASEESIQALIPEISLLDCSWHTIARGSYDSAELSIMHSDCSKASGLAALATHYQLSMDQVMALGDNNNDIEMLRVVGWGVAMGQASETVRAAAKTVTASNREDGVALAIERYVLSQHPAYISALPGETVESVPSPASFNIRS
jgi:5-amino-6-(5-phospho-D-ribitylamino)uracil phosphatase